MGKYECVLPPLVISQTDPNYKPVKRFSELHDSLKWHALENIYPIYQFFEESGIDVHEWIELAIESWLNAEGRHCPSDIVQEFLANLNAVLSLVKKLQETERKFPPTYPRRRKSRFVKR